MRKGSIVLAVVLTFAGVELGCSSSGGKGGGGNVSTSVPGNTKLASLTSSQQTQLCNDISGSVNQTLSTEVCQLSGVFTAALEAEQDSTLTDAMLRADCTTSQNDCVASQAGADAGAAMCDFSNINSSNCTSTVSDLTTCLNDDIAAVNQELAAFPTCSNLTRASAIASLSADAGSSTLPQSCASLETNCPGAAGTTSTTGAILKAGRLGKKK